MSEPKRSNLTTGAPLCACMLEDGFRDDGAAGFAAVWEGAKKLGVTRSEESFTEMIRRKYASLYTEDGRCVAHPEGR